MKEVWRKIDNFEYEISNLGNVKSLRNNIILKPDIRSGYYSVNLYNQGKRNRQLIHRLVATYFLPNPENKPQVDHINTVRLDNRVENLRWVTAKETINNPFSIEKHKVPHSEKWKKNMHLAQKKKAVLCVEKNIVYEGLCEAGRQTGVPYPNIIQVLNGLRKTAGGFHWKAVF